MECKQQSAIKFFFVFRCTQGNLIYLTKKFLKAFFIGKKYETLKTHQAVVKYFEIICIKFDVTLSRLRLW